MEILDFRPKFAIEAYKIISRIEDSICQLGEEPQGFEIIEEIFRSVHTLRGGGAMFGFDRMRDIARELENKYRDISSNKREVHKELQDITKEALDYFKLLLAEKNEEKANDREYYESLLSRIVQIEDNTITNTAIHSENHSQKPEQASTSPDSVNFSGPEDRHLKNRGSNTGYDTNTSNFEAATPSNISSENNCIGTYHILFIPNKNILKNGTNPLILIKEILSLGSARAYAYTENIPPLDQLVVDELSIYWHIIISTAKYNEISDAFMFIIDESKIEIKKIRDGNIWEEKNIVEDLNMAFKQGEKKFLHKLMIT